MFKYFMDASAVMLVAFTGAALGSSRPLPLPLPSASSNLSSATLSKNPAENNSADLCKRESDKSPVLILSIDGASVRGIAQFELIKTIEQRVNDLIQQNRLKESRVRKAQSLDVKAGQEGITDIFDLFAGTSAGAINAGAILIPENPDLANTTKGLEKGIKPKYTLEALEQMMPDTLAAAFSGSPLRKARTLGGLLGSKFTSKDFEKLLKDITGEARMSDSVKPFLSTSYDIRGRQIMNFSTYEACRLKKTADEVIFMTPDNKGGMIKDKNVYLWQAIRSASAAPVYYKPYEINIGGETRALVDAGLFVMNPTLLAWLEAQKIFPGRRFVIISISSGTLLKDRKVRTSGATAGSIPTVLKATIESSLEGQQTLTDQMMKELPGVKYHRLTFDVVNQEFDDLSQKNLAALKAAAIKTTKTDEFNEAIEDIFNAREERMKDKEPTVFICTMKEDNIRKTDIAYQYIQENPDKASRMNSASSLAKQDGASPSPKKGLARRNARENP